MLLRIGAICASMILSATSYALNTQQFEMAQALWAQRSYSDPQGIQNSLTAAQSFEQLLSTAVNKNETALILAWEAQAYFTYANALPTQTAEQKNTAIPFFEKSWKAAQTALVTLGGSGDCNEGGLFSDGGICDWKQPEWAAFNSKLTAEQRPAALIATYILACAYGQWGSNMKDVKSGFSTEMVWRVPQLIRVSRGLGYLTPDGAAFAGYGSNRVTARTVYSLKDVSGGGLLTPGDLKGQDVPLLGVAVKQTLITLGTDSSGKPILPKDKDGNPMVVSQFGENTQFLAESRYRAAEDLTDPAQKKKEHAAARKFLADLIATPNELFDQTYLAETLKAKAKAQADMDQWKAE